MRDMKRAALALLAPLAGCNWVFGLEPTHAAPDAPDAAPPGVPVHVALLVETLDAGGAPTAPTEVAIPDLIRLQAGTLDGQAPVTVTSELDGTVSIPMEIASAPWRLIYQRQGDVVREYQNLPAEAHVIEPLLGPVTRTPPPAGSGYLITPPGHSGSHATHRVYTLGAWSEGIKPPPVPAGPTLDYDLTDAISLSGGLATPKAGDRGLLIDFAVENGCRRATGSADFDAGAPVPKSNSASTAWVVVQTTPVVSTPALLISTGDVDPFNDAASRTAREQYGYLAANDVPLFTRAPDINRSLLLRNPPMVVLRACDLVVGASGTVNDPAYLAARFGKVVHTEVGASRALPGGAGVVNGLVILTLGTTTFNVGTNVAFPTAVKVGAADVFGASEAVPVTRGAMPIEVTWQKTRTLDVAHFWEVALIKVAGSALMRERVYVTTKPSFHIMPSDLTSGTHILEITAYAGRAPAANGDFRGVTGDQAISVIHTRTFVVQ
jgi:hypothetical protein